MRTILSAAVCVIALVSAPVFASKDLATAKGCLGCHGIEKTGVLGPGYLDVAKKYEGQKDAEGKRVRSAIEPKFFSNLARWRVT